jgi:hypothetical protein
MGLCRDGSVNQSVNVNQNRLGLMKGACGLSLHSPVSDSSVSYERVL